MSEGEAHHNLIMSRQDPLLLSLSNCPLQYSINAPHACVAMQSGFELGRQVMPIANQSFKKQQMGACLGQH